MCKVALTVNADDALLDALLAAVPLDMLQLHGHETPERVREVKARYGLPVMKAVGVADAVIWRSLTPICRWRTRSWLMPSRPKGPICPVATGWPLTGV